MSEDPEYVIMVEIHNVLFLNSTYHDSYIDYWLLYDKPDELEYDEWI